jgi:hypothetical protein
MFAKSTLVQATSNAFAQCRQSHHTVTGKVLLAVAATLFAGSAMADKLGFPNGIAQARGAAFANQTVQVPQRIAGVPRLGPHATERLLYWHGVAIDASGLDHTPLAVGETRVFGEQFGPTRSSRAMAITMIAIYDAVNTILGGFQGFSGSFTTPARTSIDAAIAQAAHDTLVVMYPSQAAAFDAKLTADLANIVTKVASQKTDGITLGAATAAAILANRANDGANLRAEPIVGVDFITGTGPGQWTQDPVSLEPIALGAYWASDVKPFVLKSASQYRLPKPPALTSAAYTADFNEVQTLGSDGVVTPTTRTAEQTIIGTFWAYDAAPTLCAPPRLFNQVVTQIAEQEGTYNVGDLARLLAMTNVAMADAALIAWDSKYYYKRWRPIGGQRIDDGNPDTVTDPLFSPLGAPASNLTVANFTPPFPAYPSGHATFGGALMQTMRNFYGHDDFEFTLTSDEYNGVTKDNTGATRPAVVLSYNSFSEVENEINRSRVYLGVHYNYDSIYGNAAGRQGANYMYRRAFRRTSSR